MENCLADGCQKEEWKRLKNLRLLQVREQSRKVSQDIRQRTEDKRQTQLAAIRNVKEQCFENWKSDQIKELEKEYVKAMQEVGLAERAAQEEIVSEHVLEERRRQNRQMAAQRGKIARENETIKNFNLAEKENALIRRKHMTREIEDIRSGLVVQSRDWNVLNEPHRQALCNVESPNVRETGRKPSASPHKTSSRIQSLKSPRTPITKRVEPYSKTSSVRSPVVPKLTENPNDLRSSSRGITTATTCTCSNVPPSAHDWATYRISNRCPDRLNFLTQRGPAPATNCIATALSNQESEKHEDIDAILRRYQTERPSNVRPSPSPPKRTARSSLQFTPPTRENDTSRRKSYPLKSQRSFVSKNSETRKLFEAIDKALEDGRRVRGVSETLENPRNSNVTSDSDSDKETVLKLIVNVNCHQPEAISQTEPIGDANGQKEVEVSTAQSSKIPAKVSADKVVQPRGPSNEKAQKMTTKYDKIEMKTTRNVATEIGDSLLSDQVSSVVPTEVSSSCSGAKHCGLRCPPCYFHFIPEPMHRSSTLSDVRKTPPKGRVGSVMDLSSIYDETSPRKRAKMDGNEKKTNGMDLNVETENGFGAEGSAEDKNWSSTVYLRDISQGSSSTRVSADKFQVNPVLEFYIRKLLDQPHPTGTGAGGSCDQCSCQSEPYHTHRTQDSCQKMKSDPVPHQMVTRSATASQSEASARERVVHAPPAPQSHSDVPVKHSTRQQVIEYTQYSTGQQEIQKRLRKIEDLKRKLVEVRKEQELLQSSHSSSSGSTSGRPDTSTASGTSCTSSNSTHNAPPQPRTDFPLLPHQLSTIMEVDSRNQTSIQNETAQVDVLWRSPTKYLLERNIITRPFEWTEATASLVSSDNTKSEVDSQNKSQSNVGLDLDFPSLASSLVEEDTQQVDTSSVVMSPRADLSKVLSRMDLSWAKRL